MEEIEDDARYSPNTSRISDDCGSSDNNLKPPVGDQYVEEIEDSDDEVEGDDDNMGNGVDQIIKNGEQSDTDDEDGSDTENGDTQKNQKKRKLKSLLSNYEFAPRAPPAARPRPSFGGRNPLADWSEHETFVLLDAWGERFLRQGRKSLRSEEWLEVAKKVCQESKIKRTDSQCRNRLDTLKKKYKKEKMKLVEGKSGSGRWVYFRKMDSLMSSTQRVDSGENTLRKPKPKSHLSRANGVDEARDSPGVSEDDNSEDLPPKRGKEVETRGDESSFRLLADSIHKFSEIYEKIENSKREQLLQLEKMRMQFHRELEAKKRQLLERAKAEISKIREGYYDENTSG